MRSKAPPSGVNLRGLKLCVAFFELTQQISADILGDTLFNQFALDATEGASSIADSSDEGSPVGGVIDES